MSGFRGQKEELIVHGKSRPTCHRNTPTNRNNDFEKKRGRKLIKMFVTRAFLFFFFNFEKRDSFDKDREISLFLEGRKSFVIKYETAVFRSCKKHIESDLFNSYCKNKCLL